MGQNMNKNHMDSDGLGWKGHIVIYLVSIF